jgi:hypothetical protein
LHENIIETTFIVTCGSIIPSLAAKFSVSSFVSERNEQDAESETQSNTEENHNADLDEEHDADVGEDVKKEEAGNEDRTPTHVTDDKPVVSMPEPVTDDNQVEVKDEPEEAKPQITEVSVLVSFWTLATAQSNVSVDWKGNPKTNFCK